MICCHMGNRMLVDLCSSGGHRDRFDFNHQVRRHQAFHLHESTGWVITREILGSDLMDRGKVAHIGDENRHLDDLVHRGTGRLQDGLDVLQGLLRLRPDIAAPYRLAGGIPRHLS